MAWLLLVTNQNSLEVLDPGRRSVEFGRGADLPQTHFLRRRPYCFMMLSLIINSYYTILLSIGVGAVFVFMLGLYLIIKRSHRSITKKPGIEGRAMVKQSAIFCQIEEEVAPDFTPFAGEDVIATKLDLARAYLEADKKPWAKTILVSVLLQGNTLQQEEAERLLADL